MKLHVKHGIRGFQASGAVKVVHVTVRGAVWHDHHEQTLGQPAQKTADVARET
jgi:hypothetical protein